MTSTSNLIDVGDITAEAAAFNKRIDERVAVGFVPDLRRAVKCEHFYKSFWRDPLFIRLYVGKIVDDYLDLLNRHCGRGLRILDVGCGAGYVSLELARRNRHFCQQYRGRQTSACGQSFQRRLWLASLRASAVSFGYR
jgi:SAM-dependent methyltransferase